MDHIALFKREHHQSSEFDWDIFSETFQNLSDSNISKEVIEENISTLFSMHEDTEFLCEMVEPDNDDVNLLDRLNILVDVVNNKNFNPIQRIQSALIIQGAEVAKD